MYPLHYSSHHSGELLSMSTTKRAELNVNLTFVPYVPLKKKKKKVTSNFSDSSGFQCYLYALLYIFKHMLMTLLLDYLGWFI